MNKIRVCSLFSGIGGFEVGLKNAFGPALDVCFASENDEIASTAYRHLHTLSPFGDITKIEAKDVPDHDLLVGGFPCQTFSSAGKRRGFAETRGTLFFDIIRVAQEKMPRWILLENVKGLITHDQMRTMQVVLSELSRIGYSVDFDLMTTSSYGVPQKRERVYIVATTDTVPPGWLMDSKHKTINTVKMDATAHLGSLRTFTFPWPKPFLDPLTFRSVLEDDVDDRYTVRDEKKKRIMGQFVDSFNSDDIFLLDDQGRRKKRLHRLDLVPTIRREMHGNEPKVVTVKKGHVHMRRLTPLEVFRLQAFPDCSVQMLRDSGFSDTQLYKLAGNAVSANVVEVLARQMASYF